MSPEPTRPRERIARLEDYAEHKKLCAWAQTRDACTCGLDALLAAPAAVAGGGERISLETRLREIQREDRWCICPFSVEHYPHLISCPLGIATELLDLLATPLAPDAATPCTGACARHCPREGRDG